MTYNEYKQHLEACGPLDDVAKGLLSAFELGYAQGLKEGADTIGRTSKDGIINMASKAYITPTGAFTPMTNEALVRFADLVCASERAAMVAAVEKKGWAMRNDDPFEDCVKEIANERTKTSVCCGNYANCLEPCTPRGKWLACKDSPQQNMEEYLRKAYKLTEELHKHLSVSPKI